jgi:chromosome segregation ATPase
MARTLTAIDAQLRGTTTRINAARNKLRDLDTVLDGLLLKQASYRTQLDQLQQQADELLDQRLEHSR